MDNKSGVYIFICVGVDNNFFKSIDIVGWFRSRPIDAVWLMKYIHSEDIFSKVLTFSVQ